MLLGTHALSPVVAIGVYQLIVHKRLDWKFLAWVAVAGAAPDCLDPHITLEARQTSWSHSLVGFGIVTFFPTMLCLFRCKLSYLLLLAMCSAYLWHLFCDGIAGGVPYLYPIQTTIAGATYIHFSTWLYYDAFFVIATYVLWVVERSLKARAMKA